MLDKPRKKSVFHKSFTRILYITYYIIFEIYILCIYYFENRKLSYSEKGKCIQKEYIKNGCIPIILKIASAYFRIG